MRWLKIWYTANTDKFMQHNQICKLMGKLFETIQVIFGPEVLSATPVEIAYEELRDYN